MQRYFFNVHDQNGALLDPEGTLCAGREAARRAAINFVRSILAEDLTQGCIDLNGRIEILGDDRAVVEAIAFAECVIVVAEGRKRVNSRWLA